MAVSEHEDTRRIARSTLLALFAMGVGVFVIANDFTALSVAIPSIEADFDTSLTRAQWVINAYALIFGVLIVTGGRLADLLGRKRMFMVGTVIFATFSLASALAPNVYVLIGARGLMGVGGALMWPAVLGMTYALLPDEKAGLAGGMILGVAGLGNAVGPLLGGVLTDVLSWRWVFAINLPIAVFAILVTSAMVSESTVDSGERKIDYLGVALVSVGAIAILVALDQGPEEGFGSPFIIGPIVGGAVVLGAFLWAERRQDDRALVPDDVLANRTFAAACAAVLLMSAIFFAALLYLPQFMQKVLGYSALRSGAGLIPMMGVFAVTSFVAGTLYARLGARLVISVGAAALAVAMFVLSLLDAGTEYWALVPGMVILGVGVGLFYSSVTTAAVTALDPSRSSLAGGIVYMCQIAGGAIGLGLNTAIVASASSLTEGIRIAFRVDAVLAVAGLLVVLAAIGRPAHAHEHHVVRWHHRAHG